MALTTPSCCSSTLQTVGGIILPRGCSVVSLDLRKQFCALAPDTVPAAADEAIDYSNRRTMLRVTGEGYYYGLTFMDEADATDLAPSDELL